MKCKGACGRELVPRRLWTKIPHDQRDHTRQASCDGRGLCNTCARKARADGSVIDYPRQFVPASIVLEEWAELADPEASRAENARRLAPRMGMTAAALEKALDRAVARGDLGAAA